MRNRAKCKVCGDVIESMHATDLQICTCGAIGVDGGKLLKCIADSWDNFLRVDDDGNERAMTKVDILTNEFLPNPQPAKPAKKELIEMIAEMIKSYENLPQAAMASPVTHYDLMSVLLLLSSVVELGD